MRSRRIVQQTRNLSTFGSKIRSFLSGGSNYTDQKELAESRNAMKSQLKRLLLGGGLVDLRKSSKDKNLKVFETKVTDGTLPDSLHVIEALSGKRISLLESKKPLMLLIAFNGLGWSMLDEWRKIVPENANFFQISVADGFIARKFEKTFQDSLKKSVPSELHDRTAFIAGSLEKERKILGIENQAVGYAFIVDPKGKLRLSACGECTKEDVRAFHNCVDNIKSSSS